MELLEGETLAERLGRGPLPVAETLALGRQIAEALSGLTIAEGVRGIVPPKPTR
jgi:hypothetical protein